jgi:hypothetical protein
MSSRASSAEFDLKDWHVDVVTDYVTYFPADLGFSVGFLPRDFDIDGLSSEDFVAEAIHFPAWGAIPDGAELARLCRIAAYLYAIRFIAGLERRGASDFRHRPISEDSTHAQENDVAAA